jgi:hypothetical protein
MSDGQFELAFAGGGCSFLPRAGELGAGADPSPGPLIEYCRRFPGELSADAASMLVDCGDKPWVAGMCE